MVKTQDYLGHKYKGITIATKLCFSKSRVEISAKLPRGFLLSAAAFMSSFESGCHQGERNGQVDIAKFFSDHDHIHHFQSTLHYGSETQRDSRQSSFNSSEWIKFGIEWSKEHL